jgi:hypothetical protein
MAAVILGQTTGVIQTNEYASTLTGDGKSGSTTLKFFAWTQTEALAKQAELRAGGWSANIDQEGNGYRITATYNVNVDQDDPTNTEPENQWSLTRNLQEENLLESDRPVIKALTTETKLAIELSLKNPNKHLPYVETSKASDADYVLVAGEVRTLMATGARSRRIITKTLKRSITVNTNYNTTWLNDSEGVVITTPTMISRYLIPTPVTVLLPNPSPSLILLNTGDNDPNNKIQVQYGWLDLGVDRTFTSNGAVQISQEWEWGKWPTVSYSVI